MPNEATEQPPATTPNATDNPYLAEFGHLRLDGRTEAQAKADDEKRLAGISQAAKDKNRTLLIECLGARYSNCSLENFARVVPAQTAAVDQLKSIGMVDFVRAGRGLIFYGTVGTGKDHLLAAMLFKAVAAGFGCYWVNGLELLATFRDAMGGETTERSLIRRFAGYDVLAISDPTPPIPLRDDAWRTELLYRILDARYRAAKSTWLTINAKSPQQADELLTAQVFDRLRDGAELVKCLWPSYRERKL